MDKHKKLPKLYKIFDTQSKNSKTPNIREEYSFLDSLDLSEEVLVGNKLITFIKRNR